VKIENPVLVDRYLRRLAGSLGVEENSLRTELLKLKKKTGDKRPSGQTATVAPAAEKSIREVSEEVFLLGLAMEDLNFQKSIFSEFGEDDFKDAGAREAYLMLRWMQESGEHLNFAQILNRLQNDRFKQKLIGLFSTEWSRDERDKAFDDCLKKIGKNRVERRLEELRRMIAKAEKDGNQMELEASMKEYQTLWRQTR
jgi:hypothetical protein